MLKKSIVILSIAIILIVAIIGCNTKPKNGGEGEIITRKIFDMWAEYFQTWESGSENFDVIIAIDNWGKCDGCDEWCADFGDDCPYHISDIITDSSIIFLKPVEYFDLFINNQKIISFDDDCGKTFFDFYYPFAEGEMYEFKIITNSTTFSGSVKIPYYIQSYMVVLNYDPTKPYTTNWSQGGNNQLQGIIRSSESCMDWDCENCNFLDALFKGIPCCDFFYARDISPSLRRYTFGVIPKLTEKMDAFIWHVGLNYSKNNRLLIMAAVNMDLT